MAIKTIKYKISVSGITPSVEQSAGTQGDHCATKISISIDDELYSSVMYNYESSNVLYRFDVYDGEGGIWQSEVKPLEQNLSLWLEERHTRYGGKIMIYLVVAAVSQEKQTKMELYSFPISLRLKNRPQGEYQDGENYESVSALVSQVESSAAEAREFANEVIERLKKGEFDGKDGISATHEWNGTILTIESASGKTSADLKGEKGEKGDKGDMPDVSGFVLKSNGNTHTDQVYAVDSVGNPKMLDIEDNGYFESAISYGTVPRRKTSGNIMTNTPIDDLDCTNKRYVDDKDWAVHFLSHTSFKVPSLNVFRKAKVELYLDNCTDLSQFCRVTEEKNRNNTVEYLILNNASLTFRYMAEMLQCTYPCRDMTLKHLTINFDTSNVAWWDNMFGCLSALETLDGQPLNLSSASGLNNTFNYNNALREVRFVANTIGLNMSFVHCSLLSDESIQSIIGGLKDLTGDTAKTLTFHKTVGNKLTNEQKATITAKNWTLVY